MNFQHMNNQQSLLLEIQPKEFVYQSIFFGLAHHLCTATYNKSYVWHCELNNQTCNLVFYFKGKRHVWPQNNSSNFLYPNVFSFKTTNCCFGYIQLIIGVSELLWHPVTIQSTYRLCVPIFNEYLKPVECMAGKLHLQALFKFLVLNHFTNVYLTNTINTKCNNWILYWKEISKIAVCLP